MGCQLLQLEHHGVAQRALRESREDSNGARENGALSKALQTKEQRGCVHGVSSKVT
jgi:hypothetical protein